jgi:hypothetical protein
MISNDSFLFLFIMICLRKTKLGKDAGDLTLQEGIYRSTKGWHLIANHNIWGVSPEMIDWWWDHIDTTERYKLWHPTDHVSFEWLVSPAEHGHVGAIHRVTESFNGIAETLVSLDICWEDVSKAEDAEYSHILVATVRETQGLLHARLMHEYETAPTGTRMRSHFHFPRETPEQIVAALYEHNKQEMENFGVFLPDLYFSQNDCYSSC